MKALVVEDHPLYRELLQMVLEENGFHVFAAENGREAMAFLTEENVFHLIVSDYNMPQMGGKELVEFILSHNIPFEKMYILSGNDENEEKMKHVIGNHRKIQFISKMIPLSKLQDLYFKI